MKFGITDDQRADQIGKQAVRHLVHDSPLAALALVHGVYDSREAVRFPGHDVYARIAAEQGLFLSTVVHPVPTGFDHVLFLAKRDGLTDEALIACRPASPRNRHVAGDGPRRGD